MVVVIIIIIMTIEECLLYIGVQITLRILATTILEDTIEMDLECHRDRPPDLTDDTKGVGVAVSARTETETELDGVEKRGEKMTIVGEEMNVLDFTTKRMKCDF